MLSEGVRLTGLQGLLVFVDVTELEENLLAYG
jgi:hypothetical protein